jgi:3-deoxy-D-manno-octulosonic-acid transferase
MSYRAAIQVKSVTDLREKIQFLMRNPIMRKKMEKAAVKFSRSETGATKKILKLIAGNVTPAKTL